MRRDSYILVVDDEPNIRRLLRLALAREGYRVKTASTGIECLEVVDEQPPAVILLDMQMPGMHGREVLNALEQRDLSDDLQVIVVSGSTQVEDVADMSGVEGFLQKPFDLYHLAEMGEQLWRSST